MDAEWDVHEQKAEREPGRLAAVRCRREAVFASCWRHWRSAQATIFEQREEEIMAAIPW